MALALTPRLLRRGLELFAIISLAGVAILLLLFRQNLGVIIHSLLGLHWRWLLVGLVLASMDWLGGGRGRGAVARPAHPGVRGGAWAGGGGRGAGGDS